MQHRDRDYHDLLDAAPDVGMSALLQLIEAGSGTTLMIQVKGEVWEITAKKLAYHRRVKECDHKS